MFVNDFTGKYHCSLDIKNRVNIPAGIRKMFLPDAENTIVFAPGFDSNNLDAYPLNEWKKLTQKLRKLNILERKTRNFVRSFIGEAHTASMDGQGRILLPDRVLEIGKIKKDILIIGALNKFEIWSPEIYEKFESEFGSNLTDLAEQISLTDVLAESDDG